MDDYGGGFIEEDNRGITSSQPQDARPDRTIRTMLIRQLLKSKPLSPEESIPYYDDRQVVNVCITARVEEVDHRETATILQLSDGTARIRASFFVLSNNDLAGEPLPRPDILIKQYYNIQGRVQFRNSRLNLTVQDISPVKEFKEYMLTQLEALAQHLRFSRGLPEDQQNGGQGQLQDQNKQQKGGYDDELFVSRGGEDEGGSVSARIIKFLRNQAQNDPNTGIHGVHYKIIARGLGLDEYSTESHLGEMESEGDLFQLDNGYFSLQ